LIIDFDLYIKIGNYSSLEAKFSFAKNGHKNQRPRLKFSTTMSKKNDQIAYLLKIVHKLRKIKACDQYKETFAISRRITGLDPNK
jgi:hypothetical protein